jgi:hypothetical protein
MIVELDIDRDGSQLVAWSEVGETPLRSVSVPYNGCPC